MFHRTRITLLEKANSLQREIIYWFGLSFSLFFFLFDETKFQELAFKKFFEGIVQFLNKRIIVKEEGIKLSSENSIDFEDCNKNYESENEFWNFRWNKVDHWIEKQISYGNENPMHNPCLLFWLGSRRTAECFQSTEERRCIKHDDFDDPDEEVENHFLAYLCVLFKIRWWNYYYFFLFLIISLQRHWHWRTFNLNRLSFERVSFTKERIGEGGYLVFSSFDNNDSEIFLEQIPYCFDIFFSLERIIRIHFVNSTALERLTCLKKKMIIKKFLKNHISKFLNSWQEELKFKSTQAQPIDQMIRTYLRENKALGSHDR